jgi:peptide deformylase
MSIRPILIHPDPRLKKICAPVDAVDPTLRKLADDMLETMYDAPGIGLAAPQVGVMQRLFVMDFSGKDEELAPMAMFNPEITWASDDLNTHEEGCLSIPEMYEEVTRPTAIEMQYLDLDGKPQKMHLDGIGATCAQHELDHLNGKLFIDYLSKIKRSMITNKMKKLKKERARD